MSLRVPAIDEALDGVLESGTLRNTPQQIALRWTMENRASTWFIQLALVGVK